ncbi:hypothetical protein [Pseudomonas fluorescens]|uniref:hypothetical protein n=1 Tax=Pseudomonas fluorescens TaxID=294 RepID=UPI001786831E|nr:hypothetical protein [Pseudomonas fluorescens]
MSENNPPIGEWLNEFKIELGSASNYLYNNTRQQVKINLIVEAKGDQTFLKEELESLVMVYINNQGEYIEIPTAPGPLKWHCTDSKDPLYDYFEGASEDNKESLDAVPAALKSITKNYYIHTADTHGAVLKLYAKITKHEGDPAAPTPKYTYTSDNKPFSSFVILEAQRPPAFNFPDHYQFNLAYSESGVPEDLFIHEHSVSLKRFKFVKSAFEGSDKKGMIRWARKEPGQTWATHVGIAGVGERKVQYQGFQLGDSFKARENVTSSTQDKVVILLQGANNIPYYNDSNPPSGREGPCTIHAYDSQGNKHTLNFRFEDGQRVNVTLDVTVNAAD